MYKISIINNTPFYKEQNISNMSLIQLLKINRRLYFITLKVQKILKEES